MTTENKHQWEMRKCIWCQKPHVKYPTACMASVGRLAKKYKEPRPNWVKELISNANEYVESFRQFMQK